ncbi:MAG: AAA family ATPase [Halieaceae bacterium]|nr:AAA family ATPase [Halieaceae bacterium]
MAYQSLPASALYNPCDPTTLPFAHTGELEALPLSPGQERAREAIEFGVDIRRPGFNIFALGDIGLGKRELVDSILAGREGDNGSRFDWCYVANFDDPQKPNLLKLPPGIGRELAGDMRQLVEDLLTALPSSFDDEEYRRRRKEIEDDINERYETAFRELGESAAARNVALLSTPMGYTLAPTRNGEAITPEQFAALSREEQKALEEVISELQAELQNVLSTLPLLKRETAHRIKALQKEITQFTVEQLIAWLEHKYRDQPEVIEYLHDVKDHAIENAQDFLPGDGNAEVEHVSKRARAYSPFQINVLVDSEAASGSPVVFEENPTYQNLVGRVEYVSEMGTLMTDFTLIKPGALHRANGGYLIMEADKLLRHVYAWEGLKRALRSGEIKIESLQEALSLNTTVSLEPECMPLDVKVILLGEPRLYYLLNHYDPEFSKIFQVAADFAPEIQRSDGQQLVYARMIATLQAEQELKPLDAAAVALTIEFASRLADDQERLSLDRDAVSRLLQEADHWAGARGTEIISREDIDQAIERERYRHSQLKERLGEQILRGIKLIDTEHRRSGQVNGLSVMALGAQRFGLPSRITATARLGKGQVIDIEREVKLGGGIHSKGVLILASYLAREYAREQPLALAASLVFEQSYGGVDGDSASCVELCCLLSAIADLPLRQDLAVTGSMNQLGEVQAIGGVNEKIEGFFEICEARGLTGEQGVIIPAANGVHLMLRDSVRDAVADGRFHIYTVESVDDAMSLLCGLPTGEPDADGRYPEGSFRRAVCDSLDTLLEKQKTLLKDSGNGQEKDA